MAFICVCTKNIRLLSSFPANLLCPSNDIQSGVANAAANIGYIVIILLFVAIFYCVMIIIIILLLQNKYIST